MLHKTLQTDVFVVFEGSSNNVYPFMGASKAALHRRSQEATFGDDRGLP